MPANDDASISRSARTSNHCIARALGQRPCRADSCSSSRAFQLFKNLRTGAAHQQPSGRAPAVPFLPTGCRSLKLRRGQRCRASGRTRGQMMFDQPGDQFNLVSARSEAAYGSRAHRPCPVQVVPTTSLAMSWKMQTDKVVRAREFPASTGRAAGTRAVRGIGEAPHAAQHRRDALVVPWTR